MKILSSILTLLTLLIGGAIQVQAQTSDHHSAGVTTLSDDTRHLLQKEMLALQTAMQELVPLYISGNWPAVAEVAQAMKDSYILKQKLSKQQRHELHSKLPASFIKKDQEFHYLAGMLNHAAEMEKTELISFYYGKIQQSCLGCHQDHAKHRFEPLKEKTKAHQDRHEH